LSPGGAAMARTKAGEYCLLPNPGPLPRAGQLCIKFMALESRGLSFWQGSSVNAGSWDKLVIPNSAPGFVFFHSDSFPKEFHFAI